MKFTSHENTILKDGVVIAVVENDENRELILKALQHHAAMTDFTPQRAAMTQALGWCYANVCMMLDSGTDPRMVDMGVVLSNFERDFKFETDTILIRKVQ